MAMQASAIEAALFGKRIWLILLARIAQTHSRPAWEPDFWQRKSDCIEFEALTIAFAKMLIA
jgi:hypothetical protein